MDRPSPVPGRLPAGRRGGGTARSPLAWSAGIGSPLLATVSSAKPASRLVLASTQPPVTLCRTALSMRLLTSRSSSTRSPVTCAGASAVSIDLPGRRGRADQRRWRPRLRWAGRPPRCDPVRGRSGPASAAPRSAPRTCPRRRGPRPAPAPAAGRPRRLGQGDVDQRAHLGQRRAQLMRGIGHEPALAGERAVQPGQHRVEGSASSFSSSGGPASASRWSRFSCEAVRAAVGDRPQRPQHPAADAPSPARPPARGPGPARPASTPGIAPVSAA